MPGAFQFFCVHDAPHRGVCTQAWVILLQPGRAPFRELGLTGRGLVLTGPHATKDLSHGLHPEAECGRRFIHDSLTASQSRPSSVTVKDNCKVQWISKKQIEKHVRFLSLWTFFPPFSLSSPTPHCHMPELRSIERSSQHVHKVFA